MGDDLSKVQVRKLVQADYKRRAKRNNNDDDDSDEEPNKTNSKKLRRDIEKPAQNKQPKFSRQYRDRARERREGRLPGYGTEDVIAPNTSVSDALFDAATLAVESGQISLLDGGLSRVDDPKETKSNGYPGVKDRVLATREHALDWLRATSTNNDSGTPNQPKAAVARNICQWLFEQHVRQSRKKEKDAVGGRTLQQQLQRSCYEFCSQPTDIWTPPTLDNASFSKEDLCEPWAPLPNLLVRQAEASVNRIRVRASEAEAKAKVAKLNTWVSTSTETAEDDIFAGVGTHYSPEAATQDGDSEAKTIPFQNPIAADGLHDKADEKRAERRDHRLMGLAESSELDEAMLVGVGVNEEEEEEDGKKRSSTRGRKRARRRRNEDSD